VGLGSPLRAVYDRTAHFLGLGFNDCPFLEATSTTVE
jgi:hypothetical protein